jgi:hypothetical protein
METHWYRETVDLYFEGRYEAKYDEILSNFIDREIVQLENGRLSTVVKP